MTYETYSYLKQERLSFFLNGDVYFFHHSGMTVQLYGLFDLNFGGLWNIGKPANSAAF